jgi:hypothetical protein
MVNSIGLFIVQPLYAVDYPKEIHCNHSPGKRQIIHRYSMFEKATSLEANLHVFQHNPVKGPMLPSSYRPISPLDTIGKLFEKILPRRILTEENERGLLLDEHFGFRLRLSTTLQLAHLLERVNRNLEERRLFSSVFPDVGKAFDKLWVEGLI